MTVPSFSRPGAVDLSALGTPSQGGQSAGAGAPAGSYVVAVDDEEGLRTEVLDRSLSVVVIVSFWSPQVPDSVELNASLSRLADEFQGRFLLVTVDVGSHPELGQALGIPQVPLAAAALRGQLAPLVQEALPENDLRSLLTQILQAAVSNGITGRVEPGPGAGVPTDGEAEPEEPVSRFPAAEEALMAGDLDTAIAAFEEALLGSPGDPEATLGLAQARLLKRTQGIDVAAAREAAANNPGDVSAQALAADLELLGGHVDDAFGRLVDVVRRTNGDDRDAARKHLIELF